jgi:pyruvate formate lyase activating enzyme
MSASEIARYWRKMPQKKIQCLLCSHACIIEDDTSGHCSARLNRDGEMSLPFYGWISSLAIDPVEKKPLRRFMPGTWTYSVGFWHCTMDCPFCQNWEIAHPLRIVQEIISPEKLIEMAVESGCPSISFTYSEPTLHIEYVIEAMQRAHARGLKTILVTNGNVLDQPAHEILAHTDATNVDFKTADAGIYKNILGGDIKVVQNFIHVAYELCHVEVTSLAVPGVLDSASQIHSIGQTLAAISDEIPLHITHYRPAWKYHKPPLPSEMIQSMAEAARKHLKHVYAYI